MIHYFAREEIRTACITGLNAICEAKGVHSRNEEEARKKSAAINEDADAQSSLDVEDGQGTVAPIQTSLLIRNASGFGPWRIFLSGPAVNLWRQHGKTGSLDMITKKIKYVSFYSLRQDVNLFRTIPESYQMVSSRIRI